MAGAPAFSAAALADRLGGRLVGPPDLMIRGVNAMEAASAEEITFIAQARYARRWGDAQAGAALVTEGLEPGGHDPARRALIHVPDAELAMAAVLEMFRVPEPAPEPGVAPTACVHDTATLGAGVHIGPHVSVDQDCVIGDGVVLHAGVRLYARVTIGEGSVIHANTVVRHGCSIGRGVILHQNVSIGADGFGYRPAPDGSGLVKIPQIGTVVVEDGVEIGAGSCVDRAKFGATVIGAGTKIDNMVQIGHNCRIGRATVIAALTAIAGSVTIGDGAVMGGGVLISEHVRIGKRVTLGGGTGVMRDIPDGETVLGVPAERVTTTLRQWAAVRKLPGLIRRLATLAEDEERPGPGGRSERARIDE